MDSGTINKQLKSITMQTYKQESESQNGKLEDANILFPIYIKNDVINFYKIISDSEEIQITIGDFFQGSEKRNFGDATCVGYDLFLKGECEIITETEYLLALTIALNAVQVPSYASEAVQSAPAPNVIELDLNKLIPKTSHNVFEAIDHYNKDHSKLNDAIFLIKSILDNPNDKDVTDSMARKFLKQYECEPKPDESFLKEVKENNQGHSLSNENFTEEFKENEDAKDYEEEGLSEEDLKSYREYKDSDQWATMGHDEYQRYKMLNDYE